ncbi:MAG: ABC transporter substrate-binding protein [Oscillospiraceae bacterium]|nr:ABC transporter substrate-binding protein [Oscillospiraceae bacterium]
MKKTITIILVLTLVAAFFTGCGNSKADTPNGKVNVYNWGEYIDESVLDDFETEYGIDVNYQVFDSNESMYTILKGGGSDYDVIIPSDYMIAQLISEDMLEKLDFGNIPNLSEIDPQYLNREFDPANEYSVPYMWGSTGIIYNETLVDDTVDSWGILFDPKYEGQILMFDNPRDALGIALKYLGYSLNTTDQSELDAAEQLMIQQKPILQAYVMDQVFDKMEGGEAALAPYYAGDYLTMAENNPDLRFAVPKEGSNIFIDAMCVPKGAKNKANAEKFINFMCDVEIALRNAEEIGYGSPSAEVYDLLDEDIRSNPVVYPPQEILDKCEVFAELPADTLLWYNKFWSELKS